MYLSKYTAEQEKCVPDVKPVMNFVPLVITTLEFPYHGATAAVLVCPDGGLRTQTDAVLSCILSVNRTLRYLSH